MAPVPITVTTPRVDATDVEVEWEEVASADHYVIAATFKLDKVHGTKHLIGGLKSGREYEFVVTAVNAEGQDMGVEGSATATTVH